MEKPGLDDVEKLVERASDTARLTFLNDATKLETTADDIREAIFVLSAVRSFVHAYFEHTEPDGEEDFRQRIIHQSLEDFHAMMAGYGNVRPTCSRCRIRPR